MHIPGPHPKKVFTDFKTTVDPAKVPATSSTVLSARGVSFQEPPACLAPEAGAAAHTPRASAAAQLRPRLRRFCSELQQAQHPEEVCYLNT